MCSNGQLQGELAFCVWVRWDPGQDCSQLNFAGPAPGVRVNCAWSVSSRATEYAYGGTVPADIFSSLWSSCRSSEQDAPRRRIVV